MSATMVTINVNQATNLYVKAEVYSTVEMDLEIVPQWPGMETMSAGGSGTSQDRYNQINTWDPIPLANAGGWQLAILMQYPGMNAPDSAPVLTTSSEVGLLNQVVAYCQDPSGTNYCVVTFRWFDSGL